MNLEDFARLYRNLKLIRGAEERVAKIYPTDNIKSPIHLSIGQEAISVGICDIINLDDFVIGTYRGHALYLAKGGDLNRFMAELYGKQDGCASGKGGSMHLIDMSCNMLGCSAVVTTNIPIALGFAWKLKLEKKGRLIVCFFGDGATEEGAFYESLNFASLHKLPILFVCENNALAIHAPLKKRWAKLDVSQRVGAFGIPTEVIRDMDILKIRDCTEEAAKKIRSGLGPIFFECHTYRWRQHVGPNEDFDAGYRSRKEIESWQKNDQVTRLGKMIGESLKKKIDLEIEQKLIQSIVFAEKSPFPKAKELMVNVYAD